MTLDDVTFTDNSARDGDGGALAIVRATTSTPDASRFVVRGCDFRGNETRRSGANSPRGGALSVQGLAVSTLEISDTRIEENTSATEAAGLYATIGTVTLTDVVLARNDTPDFGSTAGWLVGDHVTVLRTLVEENTAHGSAAGLNWSAYTYGAPADVTVTDSTFRGNVAGDDGAGLSFLDVGNNLTLTVTGTSFLDNVATWATAIDVRFPKTAVFTDVVSHGNVSINGAIGLWSVGALAGSAATFTSCDLGEPGSAEDNPGGDVVTDFGGPPYDFGDDATFVCDATGCH
jgi:hypothetical protein